MAQLVGTPSDYSQEDNWMKIPEITHEVDTFYIYPTCYMDDSESAKEICDIDNEDVRTRAQDIYEKQATVFEESTNVFAPYYRQSNINGLAGMSHEELYEFQQKEQRTDIYTALDYFFEHYNGGRPFIIAGHSQGSIMTRIVLGEYMKAHPKLDTERGVVVCTTKEVEYSTTGGLFGPASLHGNDYGLYYENLRENVKLRVEHYFR